MYKSISLFSGAFGLDLGLEMAGFVASVCVENDTACAETIKLNRPSLPVLGDITQLSTKKILATAKLEVGEADLVVGGPPCQPFSTAGNRLSFLDQRGNLIFEFMRVVAEAKPRFFVMENVKGLCSAAIRHRPLKERNRQPLDEDEELGSAFKKVMLDFKSLGYKKTVYDVVDAVYYGVPQFRERLIVIGSRDDEDVFVPRPTHFMVHQDPRYRWVTLREAIADLEESPGPCGRFSPGRAKYLEKIPQGQNWRALPKQDTLKAMGGAYNAGGGKMGFYRRLSYDEPSPTLVTSPTQKATMLCHPTQTRPLSTLEYARIQQFPQSWVFKGSLAQVYKQIGNAVPIGLGRAIGNMLASVAEGTHLVKTKRQRGTDIHSAQFKEAACQ